MKCCFIRVALHVLSNGKRLSKNVFYKEWGICFLKYDNRFAFHERLC